MKVLLATLGSAGDLHPFLAVARALRRRGHDVELMSNAPYRSAVEAEDVPFRALCSERDHARTATHPDLWHPVRGFGVLWRHLAVPAVDPVLERVQALRSDGSPFCVLASPLAVGARLARAGDDFPLCSVYTAPGNLRPLDDPMFLGSWRVPSWVPPAGRRALWWGLDRWKLEPMARGLLASRCRSLGVPGPQGSLFGRWLHSPDGGLALYPPEFGPAPAPWPGGPVVHADFPRFRRSADTTLPTELAAFLSGGEAPVIIFGGSHPGAEGRRLTHWAAQACGALGLRSVVLGLAADAGTESGAGSTMLRPDRTLHLAHAPLGLLLPRASAFVHHGGAGSCAEGLAAGVPQVVMPFAFDQFDNAARLARRHAAIVVDRSPSRAPAALLAAMMSVQHWPLGTPKASENDPAAHAVHALQRWNPSLGF